MAFKRTQTPTFRAAVTVNIPNDKGGFDKNTFTAVFSRPTEDQRKVLLNLDDAEVVRRQMVGWEMKDEDTKEDVPFSTAELEACLQILPTPRSAALAFWESINGARSKN